MICKNTIAEAMYQAMKLSSTKIPPDVRAALHKALAEETSEMARQHLTVSLQNADSAERGHGLVCADTGFPLFFVQAGSRTQIENGFETLWQAAAEATARATADCFLRPTMVDPLKRSNPGNNLGPGMPKIELSFSGNGSGLEIIAAPKGGGSEIFGTCYRMLFPSDGLPGIKKFFIQAVRDSC